MSVEKQMKANGGQKVKIYECGNCGYWATSWLGMGKHWSKAHHFTSRIIYINV